MVRIVIAFAGVLALCVVGGFLSLGAFPPAAVQQTVHKDIAFAPPAPPAALPTPLGTPAPLPMAPLASH